MKVYLVYRNYDNDESYEDHLYSEMVLCVCSTREKAMEIITNEKPFEDNFVKVVEGAHPDWAEDMEYIGAIRVFHQNYGYCIPHWWYTIKEMEVING